MGELRESKKRETRQRISEVATALFYARGFEAVPIDEIASAANVSKMTVFNYFARKEDLFLDREDEVQTLLREALAKTAASETPIDALRRLVDRLVAQKHPFARIDSQTVAWWHVVAASPSLKARLREIGDETSEALAVELAGPKPDGSARLLAGLVVLTWRTAYADALSVFERGRSAKQANAVFSALVDRGFAAAKATLTPTPPPRGQPKRPRITRKRKRSHPRAAPA